MQIIQKFKSKQLELIVIRNPINPEPSDIERYNGCDIVALMQLAFSAPRLPRHIRLYHGGLTHDNEITPSTDADVDHLLTLDGRIYAVVVPLGLDPISWIIIGVSILVSVAVALLMPMPTIPNAGGGSSPPSQNNALAQRTNRQRLGGRVPDIVGEVWSTPDLIAQTYSVYVDNNEVEYSYMCLGRGQYDVLRAMDDTTDIERVAGANVQVFNPSQHIVLDTPAFEFGNAYTNRESELSKMATKRYTAVNGQVLSPPDSFLTADNNAVFIAPNIVKFLDNRYSFTGIFAIGDTVTIGAASDLQSATGAVTTTTDPSDGSTTDVPTTYSLDGSYIVESVSTDTMTLSNPVSVNNDWQTLIDNNDQTLSASPSFSAISQNLWQGWFYTDDDDARGIMLNLIAPQGIYATHLDGDKYAPFDVNSIVEYQQVNQQGEPIVDTLRSIGVFVSGRGAQLNASGTAYEWTTSDEARRTAARTWFLYVRGRSRFRIRRLSKKQQLARGQQVVDEVRIKDFYSYRLLYSDGDAYNSDCTLVYTKTRATEGALSLKERKLKLLVRRYINTPMGFKVSKNADDIIYHLATDNKIGNLNTAQINTAQIVSEANSLRRYFGNAKNAEFCYTFDDTNISSEETLQTVAQAVFSQLYRFNNKIQMHFERPQYVGVAVFNSHNILPDTYTHSESFGIAKNYDGVTVKYIDPVDDAQVTLHVPNGYAPLNADEHTLVGVRNARQAKAHAWRIWNKHVYSYKSIEFTGADESNIVVRSQRIDVANQHRADVMQGVIVDVQIDGMTGQMIATLSERISDDVGSGLVSTHTLFIQLLNGQIDYLDVWRLNDYQVVLPRLPYHTISTSNDNAVQSVYQLVANRNAERTGYIVSSKEANEGMTNDISAINYDANYYKDDFRA